MKVHDGKCSGNPCTKTHAYRCRACATLFRGDRYIDMREQDHAFPFWPYCSLNCATAAKNADKGYHLFARLVDEALQDPSLAVRFPDATVHQDFNKLMTEVKQL